MYINKNVARLLSEGENVYLYTIFNAFTIHKCRLQPLLTEIKKDRRTVAMGVLDYVNAETLEYRFNDGYMTRYGFDWRMVFFETFFRQDQIGKTEADTRP